MSNQSLDETQREFFGALQYQLRGASRRSTELAASDEPHDSNFLKTADRLIRPSAHLIPAECLELYHRQYWFRLLDSIEEDFPGLFRLLGKEAFWEMIEAYLSEHPSTSYTLRHLGRRVPEFVRKFFREIDPIMKARIFSVSTIEWALMEVFEAPDAEVASPEQVASECFGLTPALQIFDLPVDASSWLSEAESEWSPILGENFPVAVWRAEGGRTSHRPLERGEFAMLSRLQNSPSTLDQWLVNSSLDIPDPESLTRWFQSWTTDQWFVRE